MKKNDLLILSTTLLYSILFYKQSLGVNYLLFSICLSMLSAFAFRERKKTMNWKLALAGTLISGCAVFYLGSGLAVLANILSIALLSAYTFEPRTSVITAWFFSAYSVLSSVVYLFISMFRSREEEGQAIIRKRAPIGFWPLFLPVLAVLFFFLLYQQGSVIFYDFTKKISLDFISIPWVLFSLGGFLLMYGFFRYRTIPALLESEIRIGNGVYMNSTAPAFFRNVFSLSQEYLSGVIMLALLNGLTLLINFLDARFLFINGALPTGISYSQFVHQGIGALIVSILFAILLILFYFRAELNFSKGRNILAWLTYGWIFQNIFMLYTCFVKNSIYIHEYSLTYKRIGVIVWLLLALFGLLTTAVKVWRYRSNYFLFRVNAWLCYGTLVLASLINWDRSVAIYNIHYSRTVDYMYLLSLSYNALPPIVEECAKGNPFGNKWASSPLGEAMERNIYINILGTKLNSFLQRQKKKDWQSYCISENMTKQKLLEDLKRVPGHLFPEQTMNEPL